MIRTDLVSEQKEMHTEKIEGAVTSTERHGDIYIEKVTIETEEAAKILSKPVGHYITLNIGNLSLISNFSDIKFSLIKAIGELLPKQRENILVAGLGNIDITPDSIGPLTANSILATRHITAELKDIAELKTLKNVSVIIPGVLGKTGIEAFEIIKGTVERTKPSALIVIDALAARRTERLCSTVQLCDSGICPGSGVQNRRLEISESTLGIPVIAIGIPTVVDIASLIYDYTGNNPAELKNNMMVTPKDIDLLVKQSAEILSQSLNRFLQPETDEVLLSALV